MKKFYLSVFSILLLSACTSSYPTIPLQQVEEQRKEIARNFAQEFLSKCQTSDYSEFKNYAISKSFERKLNSDTLRKECEKMLVRTGPITLGELVGVQAANRVKDFKDVFTFSVESDNSKGPFYLHLGMYRDKNYIETPLLVVPERSYYNYLKRKYRRK